MTRGPDEPVATIRKAAHRYARGDGLQVGITAGDETIRRRIEAALTKDGFAVLAAAGVEELVESTIRRTGDPPAAVVLGVDVAAAQGPAAVRAIRAQLPGALLVIVSPSDPAARPSESLSAGADGVVLEAELETALTAAVHAVAAGQLCFPRSVRTHLGKPILSGREKQVLGMVVLGFSNAEIAARLHLAESTIKSHLRSSFRKLRVRSREQAAALILDSKQGLGTGILSISESQPS
jgi:DNA-binding NarL/FixJ family response regulator